MEEPTIKEKMHPIEIISKERPVKDILFMLENDNPDVLLVMEGGVITGIVTDSDIIMKVKRDDLRTKDIKIKDIMSSPVISIDSGKDIHDAIKMMVDNGVEKLLVLENNFPAGVLYGEDILQYDEEAAKKILFEQTIEEVYKILFREPESDLACVGKMIYDMDKFMNLESKVDFDMFVYQKGLVLVAYNLIKENPQISVNELKQEIQENYASLLQKYSEE